MHVADHYNKFQWKQSWWLAVPVLSLFYWWNFRCRQQHRYDYQYQTYSNSVFSIWNPCQRLRIIYYIMPVYEIVWFTVVRACSHSHQPGSGREKSPCFHMKSFCPFIKWAIIITSSIYILIYLYNLTYLENVYTILLLIKLIFVSIDSLLHSSSLVAQLTQTWRGSPYRAEALVYVFC